MSDTFVPTITLGNALAAIVVCTTLWLLLSRLTTRITDRLTDALDGLSGRLITVTDDANASIEGVNTALHRLEVMEVRLRATEERVGQLERWQFRALDAADLARAAGVVVPPASKTPPQRSG